MSGYIGVTPVPQTTQTRDSFTATAGQTSFGTSGYQENYLDVYLNGVKLAASDYTATNGSDVVLGSAAAVNDILEVVAFGTFEVANQAFTGTTTINTLTVTNDGAGSNLDADQLDGQHGSYYTGYTDTAVSNLVDGAPAALNTLNELAAALGDDANFSTTVTNSIATKLPLAGGAVTGNVTFGDNNKAIFGAGSDLQIYSDGSHSNVKETGSGNLQLWGDNIYLYNSAGSELHAQFVTDGAVRLYENNTQRFTTTATGIDVTGTAIVDRIQSANDSSDPWLKGTNSGGTETSYIKKDGTGYFGGNVGIGTSLPSPDYGSDTVLEVSGASSPGIVINDTGQASKYGIHADSNDLKITYGTGALATFQNDGNVGIGTSAPSVPLTVAADSGGNNIRLSGRSSDGYAFLQYRNNADGVTNAEIGVSDAKNMQFYTNGSERMRIESTGTVLVGTTESSPWDGTTSGIALRHEGFISAASTGSPAELNRLGSDGNIINLRKDGSTVGSIGTVSGYLYIGSPQGTDAYIGMGGAQIYPSTSTGDYRDNAIDIGSVNGRFKDLYLSGGVVFGPASASTVSSQTLDDYEEGVCTLTWTGTGGTANSTNTAFKYVKVGNLVSINGSTAATIPNATGTLALTGLPFAANGDACGSILYRNVTAPSNAHTMVAYVGSTQTAIKPYWSSAAGYSRLDSGHFNSNGVQDMYISVNYRTS